MSDFVKKEIFRIDNDAAYAQALGMLIEEAEAAFELDPEFWGHVKDWLDECYHRK